MRYLSENIPTVREAAAVLSGVLFRLDTEFKELVTEYLNGKLLSAK